MICGKPCIHQHLSTCPSTYHFCQWAHPRKIVGQTMSRYHVLERLEGEWVWRTLS